MTLRLSGVLKEKVPFLKLLHTQMSSMIQKVGILGNSSERNSNHRYRFLVITSQHPLGRFPGIGLKGDTVANPEFQHLRMRLHLFQEAQSFDDAMIKIDYSPISESYGMFLFSSAWHTRSVFQWPACVKKQASPLAASSRSFVCFSVRLPPAHK